MNKLITTILLTGVLFSCNRSDQETPEPTDFGYLSMSISVSITEEPASDRVEAVPTDNWNVTIFNVDGSVQLIFDPYSSATPEVQLLTGEYYIEAHSNNFLEAAFENPYYFGRSDNFTIDKEELKTIAIDAELANSKVAINYSSNVFSTFNDYAGVVTVVSSGTTLPYVQGETREGYFVAEPLSVVVDLSYTKLDGSFITRQFTTNIDAQPKTLYNINVDATLEDGEIVINIIVDESFETVEVELGDNSTPPGTDPDRCFLTEYRVFEGNDLERWEMSYDANNQIEVIDKSDNFGGETRQWNLEYDTQGRLTYAGSAGSTVSREEFIYDDNGLLVRRNRYLDFGLGLALTDFDIFTYTGTQITLISKSEPDGEGVFRVTTSQSFTYVDQSNNPIASEVFSGSSLVQRISYGYDDKINPIRESGLWRCQDCIDFEFLSFTDNNISSRFLDWTNDQDDFATNVTFTTNQYGYPSLARYDSGGTEVFQQGYIYDCNGPQGLDTDGDGTPDIAEIPGCQENPRC